MIYLKRDVAMINVYFNLVKKINNQNITFGQNPICSIMA